MSFIDRILRRFEARQAKRRLLKELDEAPKGPFPLEPRGEATSAFANLRAEIDKMTEEKRKARTTAQRIIDLLKDN